MSFVADLADGERSEQRLLAHLGSLFPSCEWVKASKTSPHMDCICLHCGDSVEVKTDRKALTTGNLCFEGKLFQHTKAARVCYVVGNRAFCWGTEDLKMQLLLLHAQGKTKGMLGGDGWRNPLIIAPMAAITEEATIYELEEDNV